MSPLRSPETDPPRPTLRERGEALKTGIARAVGRRPAAAAADPALPEPAIDFVPVVVATPVRTPREWQGRLAPHLLAVHMADKLIRMDRAGIAAFIRDAGEHDEGMPAAMLDNLGLAAAQFTMLGELTTAAHARFYVAAGDAIGETVPPAPEPSAPESVTAAPEPSAVFERIAATTRKAAADALADDRVSPALRMVIEAHRDTTLAMLLCPDDSNEASEPLCEAVEASGAALRAVPASSIADVRAKLAFLLPEILPDVNGATPTAFLENVFEDVERLAQPADTTPDPILAAIATSRRVEAAAAALDDRHADDLAEAQSVAKDAAYAIVPTTRAGRLALAAFAKFHLRLTIGQNWRAEAPQDFFGEPFLALLNAVEAEAGAPAFDLSALTLDDLAHLHRTAAAVWSVVSMYLNAPFAWDERRENYGPLGLIIEAEVDRWEALATAAAAAAARRSPQDDGERDLRLEIAVQHNTLGGGPIDDPGLVAQVAAAWGR